MRKNGRFWGKWVVLGLVSFLLLCGVWVFSIPRATAGVEFAFSVGDGVNAYYLPAMADFVYAGDGLYYEWSGEGWLYSGAYYGPWLPLPMTMVVPPPLLYGPPPPVFAFRPYFIWWRARVAPWYHLYHPGWWLRHHVYLAHYRIWRARVIPLYRNRPFYRWRMHRVIRPVGGRIQIVHRVEPPVVRKIIVRRRPGRRIVIAHPHRLRRRVIARRER